MSDTNLKATAQQSSSTAASQRFNDEIKEIATTVFENTLSHFKHRNGCSGSSLFVYPHPQTEKQKAHNKKSFSNKINLDKQDDRYYSLPQKKYISDVKDESGNYKHQGGTWLELGKFLHENEGPVVGNCSEKMSYAAFEAKKVIQERFPHIRQDIGIYSASLVDADHAFLVLGPKNLSWKQLSDMKNNPEKGWVIDPLMKLKSKSDSFSDDLKGRVDHLRNKGKAVVEFGDLSHPPAVYDLEQVRKQMEHSELRLVDEN